MKSKCFVLSAVTGLSLFVAQAAACDVAVQSFGQVSVLSTPYVNSVAVAAPVAVAPAAVQVLSAPAYMVAPTAVSVQAFAAPATVHIAAAPPVRQRVRVLPRVSRTVVRTTVR